MRRQSPSVEILVYVLIIVLCLIPFWSTRDPEKALGPGVWLSWDGSKWDILKVRRSRYNRIESPPCELVVEEDVTALDVVGDHYVIGKTLKGTCFLIVLQEQLDKERTDFVTNFETEKEWKEACQSRGMLPPNLSDPRSIASPDNG